MTMRAYKFRIYPNAEQRILLAKHFGCARFVYNWALSEKKKYYEASGKSLSKRALQDALVASKKADKDWLNDRDINAAKNIRDFALADVLGHSACIKSSPATTPISVGVAAKGADHLARHGSQEAPTRADKSA